MKVLQVHNCGFCFGVKRSIEIAEQTAKGAKSPVYTYGPIIHNPQVVKQLEFQGIYSLNSFDGIQTGKLILRSHGVPSAIIEEARELGFEVIDATCPFVKRAQDYAKILRSEGYKVIVIGESEHPEVQGIVGHTEGQAQVINSSESLDELPKFKKLGIIAQTTLSVSNFVGVVSQLLQKADEIRIYNTICKAVISLQQRTMELAKRVNLMIVVGGRNSANTTRLAELSRAQECETHHIETEEELDSKWFKDKSRVGVTAGASTPNWIINKVVEKIKSF